MKINSLMANIAVTAALTLVPPSPGSILHMVEKAALSITVVEYVTKLLDRKD